MTQEVHRLLSLEYVRPILEALASHPEGLATRWLDVKVVGVDGSGRTAYVAVSKLSRAGWITGRPGSRPKLWVLSARGKEALEFARKADSIENDGGERRSGFPSVSPSLPAVKGESNKNRGPVGDSSAPP